MLPCRCAPASAPGNAGFTDLLVPARYGGRQAPFPAILDPFHWPPPGVESPSQGGSGSVDGGRGPLAPKAAFYWHFTDMAGYRAALIESWAEQRGEEHTVYTQMQYRPPRERLSMMVVSLVSPRHWKLERTMREWGRSDKSAAAGVDAADRRVLTSVRQAFLVAETQPTRPLTSGKSEVNVTFSYDGQRRCPWSRSLTCAKA